jgi:hypothetical protein
MQSKQSHHRNKRKLNDAFGEYISQSYSEMTNSDNTSIIGVDFTEEHLTNLRNDFYLRVINTRDPKSSLLKYSKDFIEPLIESLIESKQFTRYDPQTDEKIYVYEKNNLCVEIKKPIVTYGSGIWNDIVIGTVFDGISRNNGMIVFVKNNQDEIMMILIDPWSLSGSALKTSDCKKILLSKNMNRKILFANLTKYVNLDLLLLTGSHTFSLVPPCTVCCEKRQYIKLACEHEIMCNDCVTDLKSPECPSCRKLYMEAEFGAQLD